MLPSFPADNWIFTARAVWRRFLRRLGPGPGLAAVWLFGLALWLFPQLCLMSAPFLAFSAIILAMRRPAYEAMLKAAVVFYLYWTFIGLSLAQLGWADAQRPAALGAKMALGLHLVMAWTPMELGEALRRFLSLFIGSKRASLLALSFAVILKALPAMVADSQGLISTIKARAGHVPPWRRLALLAKGLVRLERQRADELVRALMSR